MFHCAAGLCRVVSIVLELYRVSAVILRYRVFQRLVLFWSADAADAPMMDEVLPPADADFFFVLLYRVVLG